LLSGFLPWARISNRLLEEILAVGLSASAEVSERLAPKLGMKVKAPTLLRYLRTIKDAPRTDVTVLGIDDFAIRRGDTYGTILINIETGKPLDLLPDRTAEAVMPWLTSHPEIQVVSRDRASAFADAVSRVLPHATQVADRYHLIQNLREHLQQFLDHKRTCLPIVSDTILKSTQASPTEKADPSPDLTLGAVSDPTPSRLPSEQEEVRSRTETDLSCLTYAERKKKISRDKRVSFYEEVMVLHREGLGQRAIARELHISRNTVQKYVSSPAFPERAEGSARRASRKRKLDPYLPYLFEQWDAGIHNNSQLFAQIKERGYTGCQSGLRKVLTEWRTELPPKRRQGSPRKPRIFAQKGQRRLSSRGASFLMILPLEKLTTKEQQHIASMCQASSDICALYLLSQEFVRLLKERQAEALDSWRVSSKAVSGNGTHQHSPRDSSRLRRRSRSFLFRVE
jgi:transposase